MGMAQTDDTPIKALFPDYRPAHQNELDAWLRKEAEGGISPEDNEVTPKRTAVDLYADPQGRKDGQNLDANWGEETDGDLNHLNNATYAETKTDRLGALEKSFAKMPTAVSQSGSALSALFDHAKSGRFTANSAPLLGKAKLASAESLSAQVRRVAGRF